MRCLRSATRPGRAAALALVLAALGTVAPGSPRADVLVVTRSDDAANRNAAAPPGSLRDVLRRAGPGDTIRFDVRRPIMLRDVLEVDARLDGLTIQGPATVRDRPRGVLIVHAHDVTVRALRLEAVRLSLAGNDAAMLRGARLLDNRLAGGAGIDASFAENCEISGNVIEAPRGRGSEPISLFRTTGCTLSGNTVGAGPGRAMSLSDEGSEGLTITGNTFTGGVETSARSATIRSNSIHGDAGLRARYPDGQPSGAMVIDANEMRSARIERTQVTIANNTLAGPDPRGQVAVRLQVINGEPLGPSGPVTVHANQIDGGRIGLQFAEATRGAAPGTIRENTIGNCQREGIRALSATRLEVAANSVSQCGSGTAGAGLSLVRINGPDVFVHDNVIGDIRGVGIDVVAPHGDLTLRSNAISSNDAAGIEVRGGDGRVHLRENTVSGNDGPGIAMRDGTRADSTADVVRENGDAGILVFPDARIGVSRTSMRDNEEPGIDLWPRGVTPNEEHKRANADLDWPEDLRIDVQSGKLEGTAAPGAVVEVYTVEGGPRTGNPFNGEGEAFVGAVIADASGHFVFPHSGTIECPPGELLTLTATLSGDAPVTSEFSPDFRCIEPPPPVTDIDGDGVADDEDQCPGTPAGHAVDDHGCSDAQRDDDGDGVSDAQDLCPGTPAGAAVDAGGCSDAQRDSDGDGVVDALDLCASTPLGEAVDAGGCSDSQRDSDGDGVVDELDLCASTPFGEAVDAGGCSDSQRDSDGDGVVDALDLCASTPLGEAVDAGGCSDSQRDSDGDGVVDALDLCRSTPFGEAVDADGCADGERDTDRDGVADAFDHCPETGIDEAVDTDGCSDSQRFAIGDAVVTCFDVSSCDRSTGAGEVSDTASCRDCSIKLEEIDLSCSSEQLCVAELTTDGETQTRCELCEFSSTAYTGNCDGGICMYRPGDRLTLRCGAGSDCHVRSGPPDAPLVAACPFDRACTIMIPDDLGTRSAFQFGDIGWVAIEQTTSAGRDLTAPTVNGKRIKTPIVQDNTMAAVIAAATHAAADLELLSARGADAVVNCGATPHVAAGDENRISIALSPGETADCHVDWSTAADEHERTVQTFTPDFRIYNRICAGTFAEDPDCHAIPERCTGSCLFELPGELAFGCLASNGDLDDLEDDLCSVASFTGNLTGTVGGAVIAEDGAIQCDRCLIDGAPEHLRCEGGAGGCDEIDADRGREQCGIEKPCVKIYESPLGLVDVPRPAGVFIDKVSRGGSAVFPFTGLSTTTAIQTGVDGEGTRSVGYVVARDPVVDDLVVVENVPAGWSLVEVQCNPPDAVEVDLSSGAITVNTPPGVGVHCTFVNQRDDGGPFAQVLDAGASGSEKVNQTGSFDLPPGTYIALAGPDGVRIVDAFTGEVAIAGVDPLVFSGIPAIGALVLQNPLDEVADSMVFHGPGLLAFQGYDPVFGFGFLAINPGAGNVTHAIHPGSDPHATTILITDTGHNQVSAIGEQAGARVGPADLAGASGPVAAAYAYTATGRVLLVSDGSPGEVYLADPQFASGSRAVRIGDAGDSPRDLRCAAGLCIATNFASDSVTVVAWDGGPAAAVLGHVPVGDGPIGGDLIAHAGGAAAVTTAFNDGTWTVLLLAADGSVTARATHPAPAECVDPGHALWLRGVDDAFVMTCNGSDKYVLVTRALASLP